MLNRRSSLLLRWRSLGDDRRGVSMVEFAITAPVLILLLLGMIDIAPALVAKTKSRHAAEALADVASSYSQLQTSDMVNVYSSATQVLTPLPAAPLVVRISNIYADGNGNAKVYWSCGQGALPPLTARMKIPTDPNTPTGEPIGNYVSTTSGGPTANGTNTSFVMVESTYSYTSVAHYLLTAPLVMTSVAYLQPRNSSYIGFPWDGISTHSTTVPASTTTTASVTLSNGVVCNYAT